MSRLHSQALASIVVNEESKIHHHHAGAFLARIASLQKHTVLDAIRSVSMKASKAGTRACVHAREL